MTMFFGRRLPDDIDPKIGADLGDAKVEDIDSASKVHSASARFESHSILLIADCKVVQLEPPNLPPQIAEKLLIFALSPKKYRDSQVGDLAEDFVKYRARYGGGFAKLWYCKEVLREIWQILPRPIRWGGFILAGIEEIIRRFM
jgi:hypothetical protein